MMCLIPGSDGLGNPVNFEGVIIVINLVANNALRVLLAEGVLCSSRELVLPLRFFIIIHSHQIEYIKDFNAAA